MRRAISLFVVLLASCSDGSRGGVAIALPPTAVDEASDRGTANDNGSSTDISDFAPCTSNSECTRGVCANTLAGSGKGFCMVPCGTANRVEAFVTTNCLRGEQCSFMRNGVGICARPCETDVDCPRTPRPLQCAVSTEAPGRFCVPKFSDGPSEG